MVTLLMSTCTQVNIIQDYTGNNYSSSYDQDGIIIYDTGKKNSIGKKVKHTGKTSITLQKKKSEFHSNYTTKI